LFNLRSLPIVKLFSNVGSFGGNVATSLFAANYPHKEYFLFTLFDPSAYYKVPVFLPFTAFALRTLNTIVGVTRKVLSFCRTASLAWFSFPSPFERKSPRPSQLRLSILMKPQTFFLCYPPFFSFFFTSRFFGCSKTLTVPRILPYLREQRCAFD